uniref:Uncharacterized protein n=2 Tax=Florenciella parvula TaxID=236787 RepID=A0A7S2GEN7_9STRA|mmetsp:Transcript_9841/g.20727  ORF Transcript_9841/g.20727 Transcript_9841/m.20727 type:complete len:129 (+) Transcript_9841:699-1085(+)
MQRAQEVVDIRPEQLGRGQDKVSKDMEHMSQILLRDSHYRFFSPQFKCANLLKRQEIHDTEGMHQPRMTSVLGYGRPEMASYGVKDQFHKSSYGDSNYRPPTGKGASVTARRQKAGELADIAAVRTLP